MLAAFLVQLLATTVTGTPDDAPAPVAHASAGFIRNDGQWDPRIRFGAVADDHVLRVLDNGFELARPGDAMRILIDRLEGPAPRGEGPFATRNHFFFGNDPGAWRVGVPSFAHVVFDDAAPGVDLVLWLIAGRVHYDLRLEPNCDPAPLVLRCEPACEIAIDADGDLRMNTRTSSLLHRRPRAFGIDPFGYRIERSARFDVIDARRFGCNSHCTSNPWTVQTIGQAAS